jgi:exosortase/archaeosortase family protein
MNSKSHQPRKPRRRERTNAPVVRLILLSLGFWAAALWLVSRVPGIEAFGIRVTILSVRAVLALTGAHVEQLGQILFVGKTSVTISPDCSPHLPYLIFAGGLLATPATWRQRVIGLLIGALMIHVFNVARILALVAVLTTHHEWFEFTHVYLWQIGTIVVVLAAFVLWLEWTRRPARAA